MPTIVEEIVFVAMYVMVQSIKDSVLLKFRVRFTVRALVRTYLDGRPTPRYLCQCLSLEGGYIGSKGAKIAGYFKRQQAHSIL